MTDEEYMQRALELAMRGAGWVNPNPLVGAVVVRDGRIIGEGWHPAFGELHAERQALADCRQRGEATEGATIYVTLEPCCHTGKTPPCTEALIEAGIARVVMGALIPTPRLMAAALPSSRRQVSKLFRVSWLKNAKKSTERFSITSKRENPMSS